MENIIAFAKDEVMMECGYCLCVFVSLVCVSCSRVCVCVCVCVMYLFTPPPPTILTPSSAPLGDDGV